ncbi:MAG: ABC transporter ATP-binding protein [Thermodesulfobacteriota bacterium]
MLIEVKDIDTFYGIFQAVFVVSLGLQRGEVVCLLGRNGAGKTTTLSSIVGLQRPKSGSIRFKGLQILGAKTFQIARMGMGFVPENRWIFSDLTVRGNLELGLRKGKEKARQEALERTYQLFPKLKAMENRLGGTLSGGEQQMLTVGRSLMAGPETLLLDEPTAGLAPVVARKLGDQIRNLRQRGLTILLSEQNAVLAMGISDRVYIIDKGAIVYEGEVGNLRKDRSTMKEYLGV